MKKTLLKIFLTLLAGVGIVLTSCEQPQFSSEVYPTTSLEKPVVSVQAWKGAVVLSWTPVANAESYKVVRKDNDTNLTTELSPAANALHAVDKMGFNSTLKDGGSYTYTVEAVSADPESKNLLVNSVSDPVTVSATIPARSPTIVAAPATEGVTVGAYIEEDTGTPTDYLEVYWNVGADLENKKEELLYSYRVEYIYGDGQILPFSYKVNDLTTLGPYSKRETFPLVGGKSTVKITASWDTTNYYAPASVSIPYTGAITLLPQVTGLTVDGTPVDNSLTLKWTAVTGATGYDVYKAEITSGNPSGNSIAGLAGVTIGEYETVSPGADSYQNGTDVYVTDPGYDRSKKWLYIVIAKNESARSSEPALYVQSETLPSISVKFKELIRPVQDIDGKWVVSVYWSKEEGVSYKLSRAPLDLDSSSQPTKVGAYVEIPQADLSDNGKEVIYVDKNLPVVQSYRYLLVGTKDGVTEKATQDLTASPFTKIIQINFSNAVIPHPDKLYHFQITPVKPDNYEDLTYEIYAASYDNGFTSGWELVKSVTSTDPFEWQAPDTRLGYMFSQVTKSGTTTLVNQTDTGVTTGPVYPKTAPSPLSPISLGGQNTNKAVILGPTLGSGYATDWRYLGYNGLKLYRGVKKEDSTDFDNSTSVAIVRFNSSASTITEEGVLVPAYTFYISLPKHHTLTVDGSETWYLGTESSYGTITYALGYSITKTGSTFTVDYVF